MPRSRAAGLLLHPTSLPGPYGIGDLGPEAFRFVDFLAHPNDVPLRVFVGEVAGVKRIAELLIRQPRHPFADPPDIVNLD